MTKEAVTPPIVHRVHKVNMMLSPNTIRLSWAVSSPLPTENPMVRTYGRFVPQNDYSQKREQVGREGREDTISEYYG
jgi:hypothetical protein